MQPGGLRRVDSVRASADAILVGAGTLRADNPRLLVNSAEGRASRVADGRPEYPLNVTITGTGDLDPTWKFWHHGGEKLVLAVGDEASAKARAALGGLTTVQNVPAGAVWPTALDLLGDVYDVEQLMIEGGGTIHTQVLKAGLADELQLVVAPLLVGQPDAVRMLGPAVPRRPDRPPPAPRSPPDRRRGLLAQGHLDGAPMTTIPPAGPPGTGRTASATDRAWLAIACELATHCPPSTTAFSVGAVIVAADGTELARGYSRENDPHDHAEEGALAKLPATDPRLATATIYSSLEPCAKRASRPCAQLIKESGLHRVVTAWSEPDTFVTDAEGTEILEEADVTVVALPEFVNAAQAPNRHLL